MRDHNTSASLVDQPFSCLLHLFYPHLCAGCGSDEVSNDQLICLKCMSTLPLTGFFHHRNNPVEKIFWGRLRLETAASYVYFSKQSAMQHLLHQLKYRGNKEVGLYFGNLMGMAMRQSAAYDDVEALIPLPLFPQRERIRGYNQAAVICEGISRHTGVPIFNHVVKRNHKTETQTQKGRNERWQNIRGKFSLMEKEKLAGRHVMLVDDVITTGATLEACGSELLKADDVKLSISTLAYTTL